MKDNMKRFEGGKGGGEREGDEKKSLGHAFLTLIGLVWGCIPSFLCFFLYSSEFAQEDISPLKFVISPRIKFALSLPLGILLLSTLVLIWRYRDQLHEEAAEEEEKRIKERKREEVKRIKEFITPRGGGGGTGTHPPPLRPLRPLHPQSKEYSAICVDDEDYEVKKNTRRLKTDSK